MKIESPILADSAQAANGKLFILGGGWSLYRSANYPVQIQMALAFMVSFSLNEAGSRYPMVITIADEAGVPIVPPMQGQLEVGAPAPEVAKGTPIKIPVALNASLQVPRVGQYTIDIRVGSAKTQLQFDAVFVGTKVEIGFPGEGGAGERGN